MADLIVHYRSGGEHFTLTVTGYTGTRAAADVTFYDAETYRDDGWILPMDSPSVAEVEDDGTTTTGSKKVRVPDPMMHTAPRHEAKKRSQITWTGTAGAFYKCWEDLIISESLAEPQRID